MFTEKERRIFSFQDGSRNPDGSMATIFGDPSAIDRRLAHFLPQQAQEVLSRWNDAVDQETGQIKNEGLLPSEMERYQAECSLIEAIRAGFPMVPFDPQTGLGAYDEDCLEAWNKFQQFVAEKKTLPVSSPPTSVTSAGTSPTTSTVPSQQVMTMPPPSSVTLPISA